jgi:hypothetical protein
MKRKLNDSPDFSKKLTPSTTFSFPNQSDCCYYDKGAEKNIKKIHADYENKVFLLFSMISRKTKEILSRYKDIKVYQANYNNIRDTALERIKKIKCKTETNENIKDYLERHVQEAKNDELEYKIVLLELKNTVTKEDIEKIKQEINYQCMEAEKNQGAQSEINQILLKTYESAQALKKKLCTFTESKIETQAHIDKLQYKITHIQYEMRSQHPKKKLFLTLEHKIQELKKVVEKKTVKVELLKDMYDEEVIKCEEANKEVNTLSNKYQQAVNRIKNNIPSIETLLKKIETQNSLITARKEEIRNESIRIYNRSKEVFLLLKTAHDKNILLDAEIQKADQRHQILHEKIKSFKESKEREEKIKYFRDKIQKN